ncbi:B-box zinc finger protein 20-like [Humulus lupulus]|uniref:B-box zinc finger protein 20-like n=1 Tax=Humulus lupulus TaxID=3486 RepID=UPI002B4174A5|nr:B-box zinc finger protein 20-like [Humulus lupulus]
MKIQCDVCTKNEASVYCTADEAALCDTCDHRVHHANKLASKHQRFSLLHPSSKQIPLCDICQEKRAFLFCQQDRAILCRECDYSIHAANEHTQKHNRYLLTGVKLSPTTKLYESPSTNAVSDSISCPKSTTQTQSSSVSSVKKSVTSISPPIPNPPNNNNNNSLPKTSSTTSTNDEGTGSVTGTSTALTSSISEYLIETLPGWHVEDFLDSSSAAFGFCKSDVGLVSPFWDCDMENNQLGSLSSENTGLWVPQAPAPPMYSSSSNNNNHNHHHQHQHHRPSEILGLKETKEATNTKANAATKRWADDAFTVPQINLPYSNNNSSNNTNGCSSKRSRPLW